MKPETVISRFPRVTLEASTGALIVPSDLAVDVASFLHGDEAFKLDYCSNVTGVDYLAKTVTETQTAADGTKTETKREVPGRIEVVYHLYSMALKQGPLVLKQVTNREAARMASLTPVWRACELQEREVFDLYGVHFDGHPDLRRILMWDGFQDYPMRRDYTAPDQDVLTKAE